MAAESYRRDVFAKLEIATNILKRVAEILLSTLKYLRLEIFALLRKMLCETPTATAWRVRSHVT